MNVISRNNFLILQVKKYLLSLLHHINICKWYNMELHGAVQYPDLKKKKTSKKICYIFSEKAFLCLRKQNFLIISKKGFSYTPGNETFLYFQVTF